MAFTSEEADKYLKQFTEFDWLTRNNTPWWTTSDVATNLGLGNAAVRAFCERGEIEGAIFYGNRIGWRIPRHGLIIFLANLKQNGS